MVKEKRRSARAAARRRLMFHTGGDLRNHPSSTYQPVKTTPKFKEYVRQVIVPDLDLGGRILEKKTKRITEMMANLFIAHKTGGKVLADSRNRGGKDPQARARVSMYDILIDADFIRKHTGSEQARKITRYALECYIACTARQWDFHDIVDASLDKPNSEQYRLSEFAPVILRTKQELRDKPGHKYIKKSIPFPPMSKPELELVQKLENKIIEINKAHLIQHSWAYQVLDKHGNFVTWNQANPTMRAIFNEDFQHGGRFYSRGANGYQNITKLERHTMLIDGEGIAEIDYSGFHTRILYHKAGIEYKGDVYRPDEALPELYRGNYPKELIKAGRKYVKTITNIIINAGTLQKAIGAGRKELKENKLFGQALDICNITPEKIIERIKQIHKPIADSYHTGIGLALQCEDSFLMLYVMSRFMNLNKPALSLHDAILCKRSDRDLALKYMSDIYALMYGFEPEIKLDFPSK